MKDLFHAVTLFRKLLWTSVRIVEWYIFVSALERCKVHFSALLGIHMPGEIQTCWVDSSAGSRLRFKCDGARAETRFRLSAKRKSPFNSEGASVQLTTGSRGVRISGSNAGYTMFWGSVKSTGYPLHSPVSPSRASPCAITFQLDSTFNAAIGLQISHEVPVLQLVADDPPAVTRRDI